MNKLQEVGDCCLKPVVCDRIIDDLKPSQNLYWMGVGMEDYELLIRVLARNHPYDRDSDRGDEKNR
jgi:hypothetical protein